MEKDRDYVHRLSSPYCAERLRPVRSPATSLVLPSRTPWLHHVAPNRRHLGGNISFSLASGSFAAAATGLEVRARAHRDNTIILR